MKLRKKKSLTSATAGRRRFASAVAGLAAMFAANAAFADSHTGYRFSPVKQYGIALTADYWNPIIRYVSAKSGIPLTLKIGRTSADTTTFVLAKEVDIVFTNHLFSPEREKLGWKLFGRRKTEPVSGVIVVPDDSPVRELVQLAGKSVVFPGPEATVAYRFTYGQLLTRDIAVQTIFAGNMDAALVQMFSGRAAAAGANSQLVEGYALRENKKYRTLWASEPLHDLALMAASHVPAKDIDRLGLAFFAMNGNPEGRAILKSVSVKVGLTEDAYFISSNGSEYAPYRRFYLTAPAQVR